MKIRNAIIFVCSVWLVSSCSENMSASTSKLAACVESETGEKLFIGSDKCLSDLPSQIVDGTIVIDHEYAVLYENNPKIIPIYDPNALWLNIPESLADEGMIYDGQRMTLTGKFEVSKGPAPGVYGNGTFKRGALLRRVIAIRR